MKISIKIMDCIIVFFMIIWISGCSKRSANDFYVSNIDNSMGYKSHLRSKSIRDNDVIKDHHISCDSLNNDCCTSGNRHVYNNVNKGSYSSCYYKVQSGDTLFYIAWITNNDYRILAKINNIGVDDILKKGQILKVDSGNSLLDKKILGKRFQNSAKSNIQVSLNSNLSMINSMFGKDCNELSINKDHISKKSSANSSFSSNHKIQKINTPKDNIDVLSNHNKIISGVVSSDMKGQSSISWVWPTVGRVVSNFSPSEGGNKGIDISGIVGQPIFSASAGKVVYTGDALFGYGNLIIIKHDHDFLSTYAHNDKILVVEQQNVVLGQKIATMGNSGSDIVKLHFEIRCKGRSVDPLYYLPKK